MKVNRGFPKPRGVRSAVYFFLAVSGFGTTICILGLLVSFLSTLVPEVPAAATSPNTIRVDPRIAYFISTMGMHLLFASALASLVGCAQAWLFRANLHGPERVMFITCAFGGGAAAGIVGGLSYAGLGLSGALVGFEQSALLILAALIGGGMGAVGGSLSSLAQSSLLRRPAAALNWFLWNGFSWAVIWLLGWPILWTPLGDTNLLAAFSIATGFVTVASGAALAIYLQVSPQVEF